jgi:hypothetical protein
MRDDFSEEVKRVVANRVNHRCSKPDCDSPTSGPQTNQSKALNIGVAAHITAASVGGPRYDPAIPSDERKHANNAIWLCQNCAKLIDNDAARFPVEELRLWKTAAESKALAQIGKTAMASRRYLSTIAVAVKPEDTAEETGFLMIDSTVFLSDKGNIWIEPISEFQSVKTLLDNLWSKLRSSLPAHTYGNVWVLREPETGNVFWDLTIDLAAYHGLDRKAQTLQEAGILSGMTLEIVPLYK